MRLASGESDLITDTQAGLSGLSDHFDLAPFVALQQVAANQVGFAETALTDPSSVTNIPNEIGTNLTAGVTAPFEDFIPLPGSSPDVYSSLSTTPGTADFTGTVLGLNIGNYTTPLPSHAELFSLLNSDPALLNDLFPGTNLGTAASDLLGLSASPASGVLWGTASTLASPLLEASNDLTQLESALGGSTPDPTAALTDLLGDPSNILNAFLNGYGTVDLSPANANLVDTLLPGLTTLLSAVGVSSSVDVTPTLDLGGLLSGGGSLLDALGLTASASAGVSALGTGVSGSAELPGIAVGPIGSLIETGQSIAQAIGWDGVSSPLTSLGTDLTSSLGTDLTSSLGTDLATSLPTNLSDILTNLF